MKRDGRLQHFKRLYSKLIYITQEITGTCAPIIILVNKTLYILYYLESKHDLIL